MQLDSIVTCSCTVQLDSMPEAIDAMNRKVRCPLTSRPAALVPIVDLQETYDVYPVDCKEHVFHKPAWRLGMCFQDAESARCLSAALDPSL